MKNEIPRELRCVSADVLCVSGKAVLSCPDVALCYTHTWTLLFRQCSVDRSSKHVRTDRGLANGTLC